MPLVPSTARVSCPEELLVYNVAVGTSWSSFSFETIVELLCDWLAKEVGDASCLRDGEVYVIDQLNDCFVLRQDHQSPTYDCSDCLLTSFHAHDGFSFFFIS